MKNRSLADWFLLSAKGLAMGAADVVPGVSGGTIAFITGIYEELLASIANINLGALKTLQSEGFAAFWKKINGTFFVFLFGGIAVSILSLAHLIQFLLKDHPIPTWSFFFGLILASVGVVYQKISNPKQLPVWAGMALGAVAAYFITLATPTQGTDNLLYIYFSGSIAIIAMILPGISGSFILLLLGVYLTIMETLSGFIAALREMATDTLLSSGLTIVVFLAGCVTGLLLFSRALKWMFAKTHDLTVAVLTGFLIGSLNKVWPWKEVLQTMTKHAGTPKEEVVPLVERNILPATFAEINGEPHHLMLALALFAAGFILVFGLNKLAPKEQA